MMNETIHHPHHTITTTINTWMINHCTHTRWNHHTRMKWNGIPKHSDRFDTPTVGHSKNLPLNPFTLENIANKKRKNWQTERRLIKDDDALDEHVTGIFYVQRQCALFLIPLPISSFFHSHLLQAFLNDESQADWSAVTNLDAFFCKVYTYYVEKGFWCMIVARITNLL